MKNQRARRRASSAILVGIGLAVSTSSASAQFSRREEIRLGQQAAAQIDRQNRTWTDATVNRIGHAVAARSGAPSLPYRFRVIDRTDVNAFALPGGPVYVTSGLLRSMGRDRDQLAGVLGHEVAHIARRHAIRQMERRSWLDLGIGILTKGETRDVAALAANLQSLHYSRKQEYEADREGTRYARAAGYDPMGMVRFLDRLASMGRRGATIPWLRSHPGSQARADRLRKQLTGRTVRR